MSKLQLPLISLVAAIPGGFLAYLLVMAFLNHAESMPTMLLAVAGTTLLMSGVLVLMPLGALIFGPKGGAKKKGKGLEEAESFDEDDEELVSDSAAELSGEFEEDDFDEADDDMFESAGDLEVGDDFDEFDGAEASGELSDGEFDFADDEYEFDEDEEEDK
ncbi:hypothetical protein [Gimesia maris]|uniref:Uncharacterized protein n=1 Tax=Gimesia maris TaxID=122 RepID=A0ABX5YQM0_9PLAN|nr:hypothetical protein [Gimesia maris]EDL59583.1 hypothetical protein PM8797T_24271 [Gimesia maris DSM 8797]QEG18054.1 hypothetical protein GmarT_39390 [Gimesia maris]QGQ28926.1 hypothetical protein F1729_09860 [Gimesia maris]